MHFTSSIITLISTLLLTSSALAQANHSPVASFIAGSLSTGPDFVCDFTDGSVVNLQSDGNVAVYDAEGIALWWASGHGGSVIPGSTSGSPADLCPEAGTCEFIFQGDGNFVSYFNGEPLWSTETQGRGQWLVCQEVSPWLYIVDGAGNIIWSTDS